MTGRKGTISVDTKDIFPIIKKWLYSEHDIFLRELISNACDAITKRTSISSSKNEACPTPEIRVQVDKKAKTITVSDNGIGMTETEVEKYIAQLAFSGAHDFVEKLKKEGIESKADIIGKFGLGFYSSFMVASKVEVESLSCDSGATATKWSCEGDTDYTFTNSDLKEVGTVVRLFVNEDSAEFLDSWKARSVLSNYCQFMPYPIEFVDTENKKAEKDIINDTMPIWRKDPTTLKDEDYIAFYKKLFPFDQEPLFWLHLNVDHPFTLQGILYFPKLNPNKPTNESNIKLFCKQVFVSDNVKNIIPDFLSLLKGTIDSVDIPLNVSRSALQGDPNIKKISNYVVKKVAESLRKLFNKEREKYEKTWEDIGLFVKYGVISDDKFDKEMREHVIFKNSEAKYMTLAEYKSSIPDDYKEKLKNKIIYFEKEKSDQSLRAQLLSEKIQTIETDGYLDPHFMQHLEIHKSENGDEYKFSAIDAEFENLLSAEESKDDNKIKEFFEKVLSKDKVEIEVKNLKNANSSAYFKVDESMKRFQQMTRAMGTTNASMPVKKTLVINTSSALIQTVFKIWEKGNKKELAEKMCHHVQDLASISSDGLSSEDREKFVTRSQELIAELGQFLAS